MADQGAAASGQSSKTYLYTIDKTKSGHWAYKDPSTGKVSYLPKDQIKTADDVNSTLAALGFKGQDLKKAKSSVTDVDELASSESKTASSGGGDASQSGNEKPLSYREFLSKHTNKSPDEIGQLWKQYQDSVNNPKPPTFTDFATEYLDNNPEADHDEVNRAYQQAYPSKPHESQNSDGKPDINDVGADQDKKDDTVNSSFDDMEMPYVPLRGRKGSPGGEDS